MPADPTIVNELRSVVSSGHALVVVGAGVSLACTQGAATASWIGLLEDGVARSRAISRISVDESHACLAALDTRTLPALLYVADKVTDALGGQKGGEFASWLRANFGGMTATEPSLLKALAALQLPMATTNYDGLIEGVTGWEPVTWMQPGEFQRVHRGDARAVLHFHGWWKNPESVVLGSASYDTIIEDSAASSALHALAWARSWIFVGFGAGIGDPNFYALREWLKLATSRSEYRHYRLLLDAEIPEAAALHAVGERIIPVAYGTRHEQLLPFVKSLSAASGAARVSIGTDMARWAEDERAAATARIVGRLLAVGMDATHANELASDPAVGSLVAAVMPMAADTVQLVIGDLGSGKSTVADRLHQHNIHDYEHGPDERVPIYARVGNLTSDALAGQVLAAGFTDPSSTGMVLVLDGADESPDRDLTTLLTETQALVKSWPGSAAVVFARSQPMQRQPDVRVLELPKLSIEEAEALISRLAKTRVSVCSWPQGLQDAVRRPLFALLAGTLIGSEEPALSVPSLIDRLVDLSLREARQDHAEALDLIARIAVAWLDTGRPVALNDHAPTFAERSAISRARLVAVDRAGRVTFPVPVIAEWLGAHRLLTDPQLVESVISDPALLDRWRYALTIAVAIGTGHQTSILMHALATIRPAFASWAVGEATSGGWARGDEPLPPSLEAGAEIRSAMAAWVEGLGPLADLVAPIRPDRTLLTLAVHTDDQRIATAWYVGDDLAPIVENLSDVIERRSLGSRGAHAAGTPTWAWHWTHGELQDALEKLLKRQGLPPTTPTLQAEADYRLATAITRSATVPAWLRPIQTADITDIVTRLPPGALVPGSIPWFSDDGYDLIRRLDQRNAVCIDPPWPGGDQPPGPMIWDGWSPGALAERGQATSNAALEAYRAVIETLLPLFADGLNRSVMWPYNLVVSLVPGNGPGLNSRPSLTWHLEPLPVGSTSTSTWTVEPDPGPRQPRVTRLRFDELRDRWHNIRPELGSRVHLNIWQGSYGLFKLDPATRFLYGWLWQDLAELKWVKGPAPVLD